MQQLVSSLSFIFILSLLIVPKNSWAQSYENGVAYQMEQIYAQMADEMSDLPAGVRRIAVYKMNYSAMRFTVQEIDYIRGQVESAFREYAGLTVLSPPELEPNDKMKIMGSDSTLKILNIQGRSLADVSPEFLTEITEKYGVQGLAELSIQRRNPEGLILSIRMMNPNSREITWTKSFVSVPFVVEEEFDAGQPLVLNFGVGSRQGASVLRADTSFANQDTTLNDILVDYSATVTYRQPLSDDNSAYVGFTGGFNLLRARSYNDFNVTFIQLGATYYQAITQKNEMINDYRMMFFTKANIQFPINSTKGEFFNIQPGLLLNLSRNFGLSFYTNFIISGETLTIENGDKLTYNKIGYGLHAVIRF
jgi:hypothetical protein